MRVANRESLAAISDVRCRWDQEENDCMVRACRHGYESVRVPVPVELSAECVDVGVVLVVVTGDVVCRGVFGDAERVTVAVAV